MTGRWAKWYEVGVGAYVRGMDGMAYRIDAIFPDPGGATATVQAMGRDGSSVAVKVNRDDKIVLLEPTHEEAVALAARQLGAEVIA